jgi:hypothetical protein
MAQSFSKKRLEFTRWIRKHQFVQATAQFYKTTHYTLEDPAKLKMLI